MSNKRITWSVQTRVIADLLPFDKNPRIITQAGLDQLKESFDEIGMAQPININTDGTILSGHARIQALKQEGVETVDVYVPDRKLTPKQEEAVIIRMNKNVAGTWDMNSLEVNFDLGDLESWGFSEHELAGMGKVEGVNSSDENSEWVGMPEFDTKPDSFKIIIHFDSEEEREEYAKEKEMQFVKKSKTAWSTNHPFREQDDLNSLKYE